MSELQRVRKVINWLIFTEFAENEKEVAEKIGYTKSSFSQIINGKVPLSTKFIDKLCAADKNVNKVWILRGEEEMFLSPLFSRDDMQEKYLELQEKYNQQSKYVALLEKHLALLEKR